MSKVKVLFVCLGNICRSPLAEGIFKHKTRERGLDSRVMGDSCGTSNYHIGSSPDSRTIRNAQKNGVLLHHQARQLTREDLDHFDYIIAMDRNNYNSIFRLDNAHENSEKIFLMRQFDPFEKGGDIPDPYYGGEKGFQEVFDMLDRSVDNFITYLEEARLHSSGN